MKTVAVVIKDKKERAALVSMPLAEVCEGQILVKVCYSSLNYKDALSLLAKAPIAKKFPIIAGLDLSGVVVKSKSKSFKEGDHVLIHGSGLGETRHGGFCEYGIYDDAIAIHIPQSLSLKQVMQIGTAGFTAALSIRKMLDNDQKPAGGPILVTGASGGVGSFSTAFLSQLSFHVISLTSKKENEVYLKKLGAKLVLDLKDVPSSDTPLAAPLYAGAIDSLGGETLAQLLKHVDVYGNIVSVGMISGLNFSSSVLPHIIRGVNLLGVSSTNCPRKLRLKVWKEISENYDFSFLDEISTMEISLKELLTSAEKLLKNEISGRVLIKIGEV